MIKKLFFIITIIGSLNIFAQNNGRITGKVIDKANGQGLPGVNVILKGTYFGAATDIKGKFRIVNITPGSYVIKISLIGYKTVEYTGVKVKSGQTKEINVKMSETVLTLDQEVTVIGKKPLLDIDETQSKRTISQDEIRNSIVENVQDGEDNCGEYYFDEGKMKGLLTIVEKL